MGKLPCGRDHCHGRLLTVKMQSLKEDSQNIEKGSQVNSQGTKWLRECFPDSSDQPSFTEATTTMVDVGHSPSLAYT